MNLSLEEASRGRANNIDFLRFFLASLVIFSHSYSLTLGSNDREPFSIATRGQRTGGELAVDGFFILSGFLIARSWISSRGPADYLRRRALRIYPGFLAAVAFSTLCAGPLLQGEPSAYWRAFSWREFAIMSLNLDFYTPPSDVPVNGSLWSIRYEFLCYLAVAALGLVGLLSRRIVLVLGWLACLGLLAGQIYLGWQIPGSRLSWLYCYPGFWPRVMADFLSGVLFYSYRDRIVLTWPLLIGAALGLLATGVAFPSMRALPLAVPLLGGYLLFFAAYMPMGRLQHFAARGDFSYGLYLYAFPIQLILTRRVFRDLTPIALFLLAWAITGLFAVLSWRLIERPFMRLKGSSRPPEARPELATVEAVRAPGASAPSGE